MQENFDQRHDDKIHETQSRKDTLVAVGSALGFVTLIAAMGFASTKVDINKFRHNLPAETPTQSCERR